MIRSHGFRSVACALLIGGAVGCASPDSSGEPAAADPRDEGAAVEEASPIRATLPGLFSIMAGLQGDMAGLESALWREDFDALVTRATAIADHPMVPPAEAQAIAGVLGPDMGAFKQHDTRVHDLAVRIGELATVGDLEGVLTTRADLVEGCVACHVAFRARIRAGLR